MYHVYVNLIQLPLLCSVCDVCSIFAIGDCIEGPMLAHKAEDEGIPSFLTSC